MDCAREVEQLHRFFVAWFRGELAGDEAFGRLERSLAPGFLLVSPDGNQTERADLLGWLKGLHGCRAGQPFDIGVEDFEERRRADGLVLATYVERQETAEGTTRRFSSAVFLEEPSAPNGCVWLHVHETWLSAGA